MKNIKLLRQTIAVVLPNLCRRKAFFTTESTKIFTENAKKNIKLSALCAFTWCTLWLFIAYQPWRSLRLHFANFAVKIVL
ncbi:hypothetical protein DU508_04070 [Pedobacter chinensis]|uniref:Uncharacterized protein n=1 Tax=Pedobacter chinensis TaxID=2282421 RepID=A0A369Q0X0_9SPHI|nr:hypothetical protein DU508_04070 [Pedobacter chinensis]